MKTRYYAVAPKGSDWKWVTQFFIIGDMWCSDPVREGTIDMSSYRFKRLTESEYESYIEMGVLEEIQSAQFVLQGLTEGDKAELERRQEAYELRHELDDVFDEQK